MNNFEYFQPSEISNDKTELPADTFKFSDDETNYPEFPTNPEQYPECLAEAMKLANAGKNGALSAVESTVTVRENNICAMKCGKCSLTAVMENGTV